MQNIFGQAPLYYLLSYRLKFRRLIDGILTDKVSVSHHGINPIIKVF